MVAVAQSNTNGQSYGLVPAQGGAVAIPTLLGRAAQRIPVGGRLRAGLQVLTKRPQPWKERCIAVLQMDRLDLLTVDSGSVAAGTVS